MSFTLYGSRFLLVAGLGPTFEFPQEEPLSAAPVNFVQSACCTWSQSRLFHCPPTWLQKSYQNLGLLLGPAQVSAREECVQPWCPDTSASPTCIVSIKSAWFSKSLVLAHACWITAQTPTKLRLPDMLCISCQEHITMS